MSETAADRLVEESDAKDGDLVRVSNERFDVMGTLMPYLVHEERNILSLKLENGYNVGIKVDKSTTLKVIKRPARKGKIPRLVPKNSKLPTVALLGTGGTIACWVDYTTGAVYPAQNVSDLAFSMPEIFDLANIKARIVYQLLSEDLEPKHWRRLAHQVAYSLNGEARGVVIPHGTDTMSYTASALAFMLKGLTGPVVLVGSQRSSDRPSSDAYLNLLASVRLAATADIKEVVVAMHKNSSDSAIAIHRGTKVRKMHTSKRDAFESLNAQSLGFVRGNKIEFTQAYHKEPSSKVVVDDKMDDRIKLVYVYPGCSLDWISKKDTHGLVLMGTGLGHAPRRLLQKIESLIESNVAVVMTSQCLSGRVNMNVYSTGRKLANLDVIPSEDMLPEVAYVKLMWILGHTRDPSEVKRLMLTNLAGEISTRIPPKKPLEGGLISQEE
ncbi:MAG TPA: Glu-tRNA(Gln) amidotransferase subunit GatD [Thermoplasmata archaeon]|nr:Glu-tRNA(Gln) amidotransferase subunit GatD [Thermoplasmata archaeon]